MEREPLIERQIAVLIDVENVGLSSIQWLFDQISDVGRIIIKKAYADWTVAGDKRNQLLELGIEPIQLFQSSSRGKNSSDIRLAVDAVDLLHSSPVDTFVIVSSDSDFVPLVSKLRSAGKIVYGAGEQGKVPRTLVKSCDKYFYLNQVKGTKGSEQVPLLPNDDIENLVRRAATASIDEHGKVPGSKLHQTMLRLDPSFNYRNYNSTFTKFIEVQPGLKFTRPKGKGDITVELADEDVPKSTTPSQENDMWPQIDAEWSKRIAEGGKSLPGPVAAIQAAKVLDVNKLSMSQYKTLQGLLDASDYLSKKWRREANTIMRR
ncbi:NYN domain-containing protein [Chloroflexota bacterium]